MCSPLVTPHVSTCYIPSPRLKQTCFVTQVQTSLHDELMSKGAAEGVGDLSAADGEEERAAPAGDRGIELAHGGGQLAGGARLADHLLHLLQLVPQPALLHTRRVVICFARFCCGLQTIWQTYQSMMADNSTSITTQ